MIFILCYINYAKCENHNHKHNYYYYYWRRKWQIVHRKRASMQFCGCASTTIKRGTRRKRVKLGAFKLWVFVGGAFLFSSICLCTNRMIVPTGIQERNKHFYVI